MLAALDKAGLTERERQFVEIRYDLNGAKKGWTPTFSEIGAHLALSREYVRRLVRSAEEKLRAVSDNSSAAEMPKPLPTPPLTLKERKWIRPPRQPKRTCAHVNRQYTFRDYATCIDCGALLVPGVELNGTKAPRATVDTRKMSPEDQRRFLERYLRNGNGNHNKP